MPTVNELRRTLASLTNLAAADLEVIWRRVTTAELAQQALSDVLPALIETYGVAAGALVADWYDEYRIETGVRERFTAAPAAVPEDVGASSLAGWGTGPLYAAEPDWAAARALVAGGLQRRIANVGRSTVTESTIRDPAAEGWQRSGTGECSFCAMLISRGAVYTEASADFASHDHCSCVAVPAFTGQARPVKPYTPSKHTVPDADRARVREYLRTH